MFQTGKPMASFPIETLARTILWEAGMVEILEDVKTMLKLLETDVSK